MLQPTQDKSRRQVSLDVNSQIEAFFAKGGKVQVIPEGVTAWKEGNPSVFVISGKKDVASADSSD